MQMNVEKKSTHGGSRVGAGRKKADFKKPTIAFRLDEDVAEYVLSSPNKAQLINTAIRLLMNNK